MLAVLRLLMIAVTTLLHTESGIVLRFICTYQGLVAGNLYHPRAVKYVPYSHRPKNKKSSAGSSTRISTIKHLTPVAGLHDLTS
jgi:hypothetical protein